VRYVLFKDGLKARRPRRNPFLTNQHKKNRLKWANRYSAWTEKECCFRIKHKSKDSARRLHIRRRVGKALDEKCAIPTLKFGGGNVKLWGCVGIGGPGQLNFIEGKLIGVRYIEVLEQSMLPSARKIAGRNYIYQEDNDPKHANEGDVR